MNNIYTCGLRVENYHLGPAFVALLQVVLAKQFCNNKLYIAGIKV